MRHLVFGRLPDTVSFVTLRDLKDRTMSRAFWRAGLCLAVTLSVALPWAARAGETAKVHLIGTGGPELTPTREGMCTLIEASGQTLLFDVGRGALQNIYLSRIDPRSATKVFLTHLHSDHIEGLPAIWMTPWFMFGRKPGLEIWGPPGTQQMVDGMRLMYGHDVEHRANPVFKREYLDITVHEISPGVVYDAGGVKVTAFQVEHDDGNPAFGYRIDAAGRVILLSGDTTYSDNVVQNGMNADLLVSNVVAFSDAMEKAGTLKPVINKLTTPEQAAAIFLKTQPRLAVFSHIVKKELPGDAGDNVIIERTRKAGYAGPLAMGQDRMTIEVGDQVTAEPARPISGIVDFDKPDSKF
jgi:ribonuclease Z